MPTSRLRDLVHVCEWHPRHQYELCMLMLWEYKGEDEEVVFIVGLWGNGDIDVQAIADDDANVWTVTAQELQSGEVKLNPIGVCVD
jgi:hypothetical protein